MFRNFKIEVLEVLVVGIVQLTRVDLVDYLPCVLKAYPLTDPILPPGPTCINQPDLCSVLFYFLGQHFGIHLGVQGDKSFPEAGREGGDWVFDSYLGTRYLCCIPRNEMVHCLLLVQ